MGGMKAKAWDFFVAQRERDPQLWNKSPALCAGLRPAKGHGGTGTERVLNPVAAAGAAGELGAGNKRRELGKEKGCEEDLHSCLDLFSVALPSWKDVCC